MSWEFSGGRSLYLQISDHLRRDILSGKYQPEEQLPPVRMLAIEAGVNPNTMQRALNELESEKLFETRGTLGRFVTSDKTVLDKAREKVKQEIMLEIVKQAQSAGISSEELSEFYKRFEIERGKDNG